MSRKICPDFFPSKDGSCLAKIGPGYDISKSSNPKIRKNILSDKDTNYFCPHSEEFLKFWRKINKDKDKWTKYWESKMSGIPMEEDIPEDLLSKLDKAFEEWEKNKRK